MSTASTAGASGLGGPSCPVGSSKNAPGRRRQRPRRVAHEVEASGVFDEVDLVEHLVEGVGGADGARSAAGARACSSSAPATASSTAAGGRTARRCSARRRSPGAATTRCQPIGICPLVSRSSMIPVLMITWPCGRDRVDPVVVDLHLQPGRRRPRQRGDQVDVAVLAGPHVRASSGDLAHRWVADGPGERRAVAGPSRRRTSRGSRCPRRSRAGSGAAGRRSSRGTVAAPW